MPRPPAGCVLVTENLYVARPVVLSTESSATVTFPYPFAG